MGLFGGKGIFGPINNFTDKFFGAVENRTDKKYGTKSEELQANYSLSMNDKELIGSQGKMSSFGQNMKEGITSTFGNLTSMFGGKGNAQISPVILLGVGLLIIIMFGKKKRK